MIWVGSELKWYQFGVRLRLSEFWAAAISGMRKVPLALRSGRLFLIPLAHACPYQVLTRCKSTEMGFNRRRNCGILKEKDFREVRSF